LKSGSPDLRKNFVRDVLGLFPPDLVIEVKAIACELPAKYNLPLSRFSISDITSYVKQNGLMATISNTTIWRWLHEDAIRPWQHRCWIFPRDPNFAEKAARILDLYERTWQGKALKEDEFVISSDEKTSIQARRRIHQTLPPASGSPMKFEHEYVRLGSWAYFAALDVNRAKLFGRCEEKTGIKPFDRLVSQVMSQSPYNEARRVFWIVDNGSSHRGEKSVERLQNKYPNITVVHSPVHASWLNQIEIYFSIIQRKALTPNDFASIEELEKRILNFERYYESIAKPFEWKFTKNDLEKLLAKMNTASCDKLKAA